MEKLIAMLEELNPEVDYQTEEHLIDNHLLDSLAILSLIGDIEDEFDKLATYVHTQENYVVVGGGITMDNLLSYFGKEWPAKESGKKTILAEWVSKKLDTDLKGGEIIESDGLRVLVRKLRRKKLAEAIVTVLAK